MTETVANLALQHIIKYLSIDKPSESGSSPLFVALQGPQGIGKTTVTNALLSELSSPPHSLKVVGLSIDDLYYGYEDLQRIAEENPGNALLQGRGLPGTHDIALGADLFESLFKSNTSSAGDMDREPLRIPSYDKSLHDGKGDRVPTEHWKEVRGPVDVVLVEGWCLGFYPILDRQLEDIWDRRMQLGMPESLSLKDGIIDIKNINKLLEKYVQQWYSYFSCFIQISSTPSDGLAIIYKWRLQQEHAMKAKNGGRGMTDEQVTRFIDRYIPGYLFFGAGPQEGDSTMKPPWSTKGLKITVNQEREVVGTEEF